MHELVPLLVLVTFECYYYSSIIDLVLEFDSHVKSGLLSLLLVCEITNTRSHC